MKSITIFFISVLCLAFLGWWLLEVPPFLSSTKTIQLTIERIHCETCSESISAHLSSLNGVNQCNISVEDGQALIRYNSKALTADRIRQAVQETGFNVTNVKPE